MGEEKSFLISHQGPLPSWEDALMLGNGTLGVLAYGQKSLLFSLDRLDLWDKRIPPELKEKGYSYANLVKTAKKNWGEYFRLFDASYNHPYPSKINAGTLSFDVSVGEKDSFSLAMKKALLSLSIGKERASVRIGEKQNVIVFDVPSAWAYSFSFPAYFYRSFEEKGLAYPPAVRVKEGDFQILYQPMTPHQGFLLVIHEVRLGERKKIYLTILLGSRQAATKGEALLRHYEQNEEKSLQIHDGFWTSYFARSSIVTPDQGINDLYQRGRYFFASNSQGSYPLSLQGIWSRNDGSLPPWKGDYHNDINLEMSYSSYLMGNTPKEGRVLVDYLWRKRKTWQRFASSFAGVKGYLIPGVMAQNGLPLGGWPMYAYNPLCGVWLAKAFDDYYRYYGERRFLEERAYPFLKEIGAAIRALLKKDETGHWVLPLSSSPEMFDDAPGSLFPTMSTFDLSLLHWLYRTLEKEATLLGKKKEAGEARAIREGFEAIPKSSQGETLLARGIPLQESHRHFSHLLYEKELEEISFFSDPNQLKRDLGHLEKLGTKQWVGFSFTEMSELASYAHEGEVAIRYLKAFQAGFVGDNGFHRNMDFAHKGYSDIVSDAFTLEANIGFVDALQKAMASFVERTLSLFPGLNEEWKEKGVSFEHLRLPEGILLSGKIIHQKLSFTLTSSKPLSFDLYDDFAADPTLLIDGRSVHFKAALGECISLKDVKEVSLL